MTQRKKKEYAVNDISIFIEKVISWAQGYDHFTYFNPNNITYPFDPFDHFIAIGCHKKLVFENLDDFELLKQQFKTQPDWLVGYFGYDLKNQLEKLNSNHLDRNEFYPLYFYIPKHLLHFYDDHITIASFDDLDEIFDKIQQCTSDESTVANNIEIVSNVSQKEYIDIVKRIQQHIIDGDVYELNYCMEFYSQQVDCNPVVLYKQLTKYSPTPFSIFQRIEDQYLICASPERFIKKTKDQLISQPIKGTIKRGLTSAEDFILQDQLKHSEKECAENMMIVDLVRNDLARSCVAGTIQVEELFGIYPFKYLHQMISTISGILRDDVHFVDAIRNAFPMGSMTGTPKVMAMKLIEQYETSKRGLFSGSAGYITPSGNFDFNVVIRSIFYAAQKKTLSFQVGSAITYDSDPEQEYQECLLKAKAIQKVFNR